MTFETRRFGIIAILSVSGGLFWGFLSAAMTPEEVKICLTTIVNEGKTRIHYLGENTPERMDKYGVVLQIFNAVSANLFSKFRPPREFSMLLSDRPKIATANRWLHIKSDQVLGKGNVDFAVASNVHETTHLFFAENMRDLSPEWAAQQLAIDQYIASYPERNARAIRIVKIAKNIEELETLQKRGIVPNLQSEILELRSQLEFFEGEMIGQPQKPEAPLLLLRSLPYQEILTDVASVFALGDPVKYADVLVKGVGWGTVADAPSPEAWAQVRARAFIVEVPVEGWNLKVMTSVFESSEHILFNPVRSFIRDQYLSQGLRNIDGKTFLWQLFLALGKDLNEAHQDPNFNSLFPEQHNERLIQRLQKELKQFEARPTSRH